MAENATYITTTAIAALVGAFVLNTSVSEPVVDRFVIYAVGSCSPGNYGSSFSQPLALCQDRAKIVS